MPWPTSTRRLGMRPALMLAAVVATASTAAVSAPAGAAPRSRPDLTVATGSLSQVGAGVSGRVRVKNRGSAKAGATTAVVYAQLGPSASGRTELGRLPVRSLLRGTVRDLPVTVPLPSGLPAGDRSLVICVDATRRIAESSERNNCRTIGRLVTLQAPLAAPVPPAVVAPHMPAAPTVVPDPFVAPPAPVPTVLPVVPTTPTVTTPVTTPPATTPPATSPPLPPTTPPPTSGGPTVIIDSFTNTIDVPAWFRFHASVPGSTFECAVDLASTDDWNPCDGALIRHVDAGPHSASFRATSPDGLLGPTLSVSWISKG